MKVNNEVKIRSLKIRIQLANIKLIKEKRHNSIVLEISKGSITGTESIKKILRK